MHPRLARELKTVRAMIGIYCADKHGQKELCRDCAELAAYAANRLEHCVYGGGKPACKDCPVHCYAPHRRTKIQEVMRYAGPRMLTSHPYLALRHVLDGLGKKKGRKS